MKFCVSELLDWLQALDMHLSSHVQATALGLGFKLSLTKAQFFFFWTEHSIVDIWLENLPSNYSDGFRFATVIVAFDKIKTREDAINRYRMGKGKSEKTTVLALNLRRSLKL